MNSQTYAQENAGRRIRVYTSSAGPNRRLIKWPVCRVVGYDDHNDEMIYVEFEDQPLHQYCQPANQVLTFVRTAESKYPGIWAIPHESVRFLRPVKKEKPAKVIKPYPHSCPKCHSPARNCAAYVLCSNVKCTANRAFKKTVLSKIPKMNRLKCSKCGNKAVEVGAARSKDGSSIVYRLTCSKNHSWTHIPKANDLVSRSAIRAGEKDLIWNDGKWMNANG